MDVHSKRSTVIVAHRGASYAAPENTLPAFELAFKENADFIEGDFWMTRDGQVVCIHDPNVSRVTQNKWQADVRRISLAELKKIDVGSWKGPEFKGTTIPTLQEILDILPQHVGIFIELKDTRSGFLNRIKTILNDYKITPGRARLIAFDPQVVNNARTLFPDFKIYWLYNWYKVKETGGLSNSREEIFRMLKILPCDGLNINPFPWIDVDFVETLRRMNMDFCVYNVNRFSDALKLVTLGVDAIATNCPGKIRQQLKNYFEPQAFSRAKSEELEIKKNGEYHFRNHPIETGPDAREARSKNETER